MSQSGSRSDQCSRLLRRRWQSAALPAVAGLIAALGVYTVPAPTGAQEVVQAESEATYLYWSDNATGTIGRATLDGSEVDHEFIEDAGRPLGVTVGDTHIYWADSERGTISRARLDGSEVDPSFVDGFSPQGVTVGDTHIYWAEYERGTIGRARLDGLEWDPEFIDDAAHPIGVAVSDTQIYWANTGTDTGDASIGAAALDGNGANQDFIPILYGWPTALTVDNTASRIYWSNLPLDEIGWATLDGFEGPSIKGVSGPRGVAVHGDYLYWTDYDNGTIGRIHRCGCEPSQEFISGALGPWAVAVGPGADPPEATIDPDALAFGDVPVGQRSATGPATVTNSGGGTLMVDSVELVGNNPRQFQIDSNDCNDAELAAGESCEIGIVFAPTWRGDKQAAVEVTHNADGSPGTVLFTGTGV